MRQGRLQKSNLSIWNCSTFFRARQPEKRIIKNAGIACIYAEYSTFPKKCVFLCHKNTASCMNLLCFSTCRVRKSVTIGNLISCSKKSPTSLGGGGCHKRGAYLRQSRDWHKHLPPAQASVLLPQASSCPYHGRRFPSTGSCFLRQESIFVHGASSSGSEQKIPVWHIEKCRGMRLYQRSRMLTGGLMPAREASGFAVRSASEPEGIIFAVSCVMIITLTS